MKLIDLDSVLQEIRQEISDLKQGYMGSNCVKDDWLDCKSDILEIIDKHIKEIEPKTGHWIEHPTEEDYSVCSRCGIGSRRMEHGKNADGTKYIDIYSYRFCPYCGARMAESEDDEC